MKKFLSFVIALALAVSTIPAAFASEIDAEGAGGSVPVVLTQEATSFSVTVPTALPVYVSADHEISVATDAKIINNNFGSVRVKSLTVEDLNGWTLRKFETDFSKSKVDSYEYGLQFMGSNVNTDGSCSVANFSVINGNSSLHFDYDANISMLSNPVELNIAKVVFVVGWNDGSGIVEPNPEPEPEPNPEPGPGPGAEALTEYPWEYTVQSDGTANLTKYIGRFGSDVNLVVPNTIGGYAVSKLEDCIAPTTTNSAGTTKQYSDVVFNKVTIEDGVTLASRTFREATINDLYIGKNVIFENSYLDNMSAGYVSTPFGYAGAGGYHYMVKGVNINSIETHSVIPNGATFGYCDALTRVIIGSEVSSLNRFLFRSCSNLSGIIVMNTADGITLTTPGGIEGNGGNPLPLSYYKFMGTDYDSDAIPIILNSSNINMVGYTAGDTSLVIPSQFDYEGSKYTVVGIGDNTFKSQTKLTSIEIPASVDSIGTNAFDGCTGLTTVVFNGQVSEIKNYTFNNCMALTTCELPDGVTSIGTRAFYGCKVLNMSRLPSELVAIGDNAFYNCKALSLSELPDGVSTIEKSAFGGCSALALTALPSSVDSIGIGAFANCTSLTVNNIHAGTTVGNVAFQGCTGITDMTVGSNATIGTGVFQSCTNLNNVTFGSGVTIADGSNLFNGCSKLQTVDLSAADITTAGKRMFYQCKMLTTVQLPSSLNVLGEEMFVGCTSLVFDFTGITEIGAKCFNGSTFTSVEMPDVVTIGANAFQWSSSLESVSMPKVETIGKYAFANCSSLTSVTMPHAENVSIGSSAFYKCGDITYTYVD